ncbi:unnamed protein product [Bathycoccus prasinos]
MESLASTKMHSSRCIKSSCVPEPSQFFPFDEEDIVVFVVAIDLSVQQQHKKKKKKKIMNEKKTKKKKNEIPLSPKTSSSRAREARRATTMEAFGGGGEKEEKEENGWSRQGKSESPVSPPQGRVSSMRASSCDSLGVMFAEQMKTMNTTTTTSCSNTNHPAVKNVKSTLLEQEEDEEDKKSSENKNTTINTTNHHQHHHHQQQNDRNSEIFGNTDQIPYEKATVLTKLQKWGDYESCGENVGKTKFVPMKTPLSLEFLDQMEKYAHILTVEKMLYEQRETKQREVTMIIDLSNHECLYEEDIPKEVHRVHVRNIAKSIPNIECCAKVMREATKHWKKHPEQYIAIHCAYGFNRTGFIVCSYLIEKENMTAEEALEAFAIARPPGVKHERFQLALKARYPTRGCKPKVTEYDDDKDDDKNENGLVKNETVEGVNAVLRINKNNGFAAGSGEKQKKKETLVRKLFSLIRMRRKSSSDP